MIVDSVEQGQVEVTDVEGIMTGKLIFTRPHLDGTEPLDFDPRGELIEVLQGDMIILESLFPNE